MRGQGACLPRTAIPAWWAVRGEARPPPELAACPALPFSEPGDSHRDERAQVTVSVCVPGLRSVPLSSFGAALQRNALESPPQTLKGLTSAWRDESADDSDLTVRTAADATSLLLLDLGVLLFRQQCSTWQRTGKAWASASKIEGTIRYFLKGLHVGRRPMFDVICAYGGHLLYGNLGETGVSNKRNGPPVDIVGNTLTGLTADDAQPPFLLRWSP